VAHGGATTRWRPLALGVATLGQVCGGTRSRGGVGSHRLHREAHSSDGSGLGRVPCSSGGISLQKKRRVRRLGVQHNGEEAGATLIGKARKVATALSRAQPPGKMSERGSGGRKRVGGGASRQRVGRGAGLGGGMMSKATGALRPRGTPTMLRVPPHAANQAEEGA
jgi:hypothetical protein